MVPQQPTVTSGGHSGQAILMDLGGGGGRDHVQPPHPLGMDGGDGDPAVTPTSITGGGGGGATSPLPIPTLR